MAELSGISGREKGWRDAKEEQWIEEKGRKREKEKMDNSERKGEMSQAETWPRKDEISPGFIHFFIYTFMYGDPPIACFCGR